MQVRRLVNMLAVASIVVGTTTACATKKFVRTEVETVGTRVETLSQSIEATQQETRQNQARITQVDQKADQVGIWAKEAQTSASSANAAATAASAKIDAVDAQNKRLVYEVVISEDQGQFKFGSAALPETVQQRIDQMIADLKANPRGNFVEIEGHTDSSGDKVVNQRIGEAARRGGEALSLRDASGAAAQDERHQLGRRQARQPEQHARRPRPESPGRHSRACVTKGQGARGEGQLRFTPLPSLLPPLPLPLFPYPSASSSLPLASLSVAQPVVS